MQCGICIELWLFQKQRSTRSWPNITSMFWSDSDVFFIIKLSSHSSKCALHYLDNNLLVRISKFRHQSQGTCSLPTDKTFHAFCGTRAHQWILTKPEESTPHPHVLFMIHLNVFLSLTVQSFPYRISTQHFIQYAFWISSICATWSANGVKYSVLHTWCLHLNHINCIKDCKWHAPSRPCDCHWSHFRNTQVHFKRLRKEVLHRVPWKYDKWFGH